jgi:hypothetical protein
MHSVVCSLLPRPKLFVLHLGMPSLKLFVLHLGMPSLKLFVLQLGMPSLSFFGNSFSAIDMTILQSF